MSVRHATKLQLAVQHVVHVRPLGSGQRFPDAVRCNPEFEAHGHGGRGIQDIVAPGNGQREVAHPADPEMAAKALGNDSFDHEIGVFGDAVGHGPPGDTRQDSANVRFV